MIPGINKLEYEDRLRKLKLPTLAYRRYRGDMIEAWKMTHEKYDEDALGSILEYKNGPCRSHPFGVYKQQFKHDFRNNSFRLRTTDQWNNLPAVVVTANSVNSFKNRLDKLWWGSKVMFDPDTNVHEVTAARQTRYKSLTIDDRPNDDLMQEA